MQIYDNSNISESYGGQTTPLTFSFLKYVYSEVYVHFSKMMGVSNKEILKNSEIFNNMVVFLGFRVYYNLTNWYSMLGMFPGSKFSGELMEKMMGVKDHLEIKGEKQEKWRKYLIYLPKTILQSIFVIFAFVSLKWRVPMFNKKFDSEYSKMINIKLRGKNLKDLKSIYTDTATAFLEKWKIPITNDFAVMVSTGLADKLLKKWLNAENTYELMQLSVKKKLSSLDAGKRLHKITKLIGKHNEIKDLFKGNNSTFILDKLRQNYFESNIYIEFNKYIKDFSLRIPNELKLESKTLKEDPLLLISILKESINREEIVVHKEIKKNNIRNTTRINIFKFLFLKWLVKWAGKSIHRRESSRFKRTLVFGHVRNIFLEIGNILYKKNLIISPDDIFFLKINEIFDFIDNKNNFSEVKNIIKKRKELTSKYKNIKMQSRYETNKNYIDLEKEILIKNSNIKEKESKMLGQVASRPNKLKKISGKTLVLKDFCSNADFNNKILVTQQTDPGWTIIFPLLKAIVVERGGALSHAAIVARELGIPCIVGVDGAVDTINDNVEIELDLLTGVIKQKE